MSPIKGISESRRLPRLGKIHLGVKKTKKVGDKEVEYPSAVDYFVFPKNNPLYEELLKVFGEKPKELRILIPVEDEERWASQYYRCYSMTRGLICRGDGNSAIRMVDTRTGALANHESQSVVMKEMSCQGRECPDYEKQCREIMNLQFLLPEVPGLGIWQIDTSSINSMRNINSAADLVKRIYGKISMVPLLLTTEPQVVQDAAGKKRTVNVLNLRTNRTLLEMMETINKPALQMLTTPDDTDIDDTEMPIPDSETPEMIIPQVQEEKVTREADDETEKGKDKSKRKPAAKSESQEVAKPKETTSDPQATQDEKREIVQALRAKGKTDENIREIFYSITGKKKAWLRSDIEKLNEYIQKEDSGTSADSEAEDFLKDFEG